MGKNNTETVRIPIGIKLISLLAAAILIAVAAVGLESVRSAREAMQESILYNLDALAKAREHEISSLIEQDFERTALIASRTNLRECLVGIQENDPQRLQLVAKMNRILDDALRSLKDLREISATNVQGRIIASTNQGLIGLELADSHLFLNGKAGYGFGKLESGPTMSAYSVTASMVHPKTGAFIGVVLVKIELQRLAEVLHDRTGLGQTGELVLGTKEGLDIKLIGPLRYIRKEDAKRSTRLDSGVFEPMHLAIAQKEGITMAQDYRSVEVLAAYRHIPVADWGLVAKIDAREAFQPISALQVRVALLGSILTFLAVGCAYLLSKMVSKPIQALHNGVEKISRGHLDYRIKIRTRDELGDLGRAFNHMAALLEEDTARRKQAEDALHRLNRKLRAISNCNQVLIKALDEQTLLKKICRIVCEEAGYRMAWVGYLQNDTTSTVRPVAWAGFEKGYLAEAKITRADTERGRGPTGRAIREGVSACIQDFATDPLAAPWRRRALQRGYRSSTALPLKDENSIPFGALCIYSAQPGTFTSEEMKLLEELAANLAFGICVLRTRAAQKQSEQELILREQQYRTLLESVPDFIVRYDLDLQLIYVNPAWEKASGLSAAEVIGLAHTDIPRVPSPSVDEYTKKLRIAMETGASQAAEFTWVNAHGAKLFLEYVIVPEYDQHGNITGVLAVGHDITERKKAEERIKESEAKYMDLYENAPDMYISINAETALIEECNRTFLNTLGYSKKEIIGRPVFDIYHLDCLEKARETFRLFAKTGEVHDQELQLQKKDGSKLDVGLNVTSVCGEDGKILFSRAILRDITERKRNNAINLARLHLMRFASTHSLDDFLEESLNEAEKLTQSKIGFFVFVEDDQVSVTLQNWSTRTKAEFCKAKGKGLHYKISEAGVWVDCIIQAKPVIHNDYASLSHRKGMPEGHAALTRELVVPVLRGDKIKAVVAVGNKQGNYDETDVEAVSILADLTWEIAERKRAEEKMLRSDQRLRLHSEQSPLGFLEWDDHFCAIEWNAACERIFGYARDEAIGRHAKDLILPVQVHELVDGIFQSLMQQTGGQHSINENVTKDDRIIICEWFNTTLIDKDGKAIGVASVCRDITKQKRLEEELARHREHLEEQVKKRTVELEIARNKAQQYLDIAGVILVAIDKNRKVALINQKGCEVLQSTASEIIGKDWFETFVPQNQRQEVIKAFEQLMAGELEPVEYFENSVLTQDGRERLVAWHNVLLRDGKGHITGTLSSGEDITERRHADKQITSLNQDLRSRAAALEAANKELDAFAYTVSHDLRAPLRHIDGFLELLQKETGTALNEQSRHYMDTISEAAKKMGLLIDDLLYFSRMGRHALSLQQVEMGTLVREIIRELEPDATGRTIEWRIGDLPSINGDERMLRIVLTNLISNALKFTRTRPRAWIEIGSLPDQDSESVFFVRDNGVGFDMAYAQKLFGVFQRLHRADDFEGTGIGLASVRRIIARHGGRTWAQGEPDRGAAFYFALPRT